MLDKWFKKSKNDATESVQEKPKMVFSGKPSKKKKNTYVVSFSGFADATLWSLCKETPLPVIKYNGQEVPHRGGIYQCVDFPNPSTTQMAQMANNPKWCEFMGQMHQTIVTYLDKDTNKIVLMLFPTNAVLINTDSFDTPNPTMEQALARLNHATRRDFINQRAKRAKMIDAFRQRYNY